VREDRLILDALARRDRSGPDPESELASNQVGGRIAFAWLGRLCFICERYGACIHREPAIAAAELERLRRLRRRQRSKVVATERISV